jgi:hypothetical protein
MDEGPLYPGCLGNIMSLEAIPNPAGVSFPEGEPHWTIQSQPAGGVASLDPCSGSATTILSGLHKYGEYVVKAKCDGSEGDTITVKFNLVDESGWKDYPLGEVPGSCGGVCDGEDATIFDGCENELEVSCAQEDGTGGIGDCAYRYFYNDNLISSCIWATNAGNKWWYKDAKIEGTILRFITKARHTTVDGDKFDSEGCDGYYCSLVTIYNCLTGESTKYWRRSATIYPWLETAGEGHVCAGPETE